MRELQFLALQQKTQGRPYLRNILIQKLDFNLQEKIKAIERKLDINDGSDESHSDKISSITKN